MGCHGGIIKDKWNGIKYQAFLLQCCVRYDKRNSKHVGEWADHCI